jgi:hypothetical protein
MANAPTGEFYYAAAGSGGWTAATTLIAVFLRSVVAGEPLETALRAPRLHHNGVPDVVFHEADAAPAILAALARRGHRLRETGILGRVNAIWCADALPQSALVPGAVRPARQRPRDPAGRVRRRPVVLKVAKRGSVPPFYAMEVLRAANARAAAGESVLHLEIGQPSTGAPRAVVEAAKQALDRVGYTEALGCSALRQRIARHC